jgi:hypothetical protein
LPKRPRLLLKQPGIEKIIMARMVANEATTRDAAELGYQVRLVRESVAAPRSRQFALVFCQNMIAAMPALLWRRYRVPVRRSDRAVNPGNISAVLWLEDRFTAPWRDDLFIVCVLTLTEQYGRDPGDAGYA